MFKGVLRVQNKLNLGKLSIIRKSHVDSNAFALFVVIKHISLMLVMERNLFRTWNVC